ncbi:hypothetical protein BIV57_12765 [Mangrovactinospora gilvigrisea]|uniref:Helix-turn-helix domain-containing protein n=1 Tax=Mangrovactinospora gilvigrisea TaxID=1428644 RepID=A0A1J7BUH4_9ACTN|nr:hypothetical protein [Mangrovactinospora gilvigrisea]OIV37105.1 hypothetical protein BIV57_12765 [Mangrovactinospora gilvigrisea]
MHTRQEGGCTLPKNPTLAHTLVTDRTQQHIATTASRRTRHASDFLPAVRFMIDAGFHPDAGPTTLRLAHALAVRMHRSRDGHIPYSLERTCAQLGLGRSTVAKHAKILRELGLLAWAQHGTRANALPHRDHPRAGYRPTATLYAPCTPPVYDQAMGHRTRGTGYTARLTGRTRPPRTTRKIRRPWTPSVTSNPSTGHVTDDRTTKNPARSAATNPPTSSAPTPRTPTRTPRRPRRSPAKVQADIALAAQVRPRVPWTQRLPLRRLAFALRPMIDAGLDAAAIAAELAAWAWSWPRTWRPSDIAGYLLGQLNKGRGLPASRDTCGCGCGGRAQATPPNSAFAAAFATLAAAGPKLASNDPDQVPADFTTRRELLLWKRQRDRDIQADILASLRQAGERQQRRALAQLPFAQWLEAVEDRSTWYLPHPAEPGAWVSPSP